MKHHMDGESSENKFTFEDSKEKKSHGMIHIGCLTKADPLEVDAPALCREATRLEHEDHRDMRATTRILIFQKSGALVRKSLVVDSCQRSSPLRPRPAMGSTTLPTAFYRELDADPQSVFFVPWLTRLIQEGRFSGFEEMPTDHLPNEGLEVRFHRRENMARSHPFDLGFAPMAPERACLVGESTDFRCGDWRFELSD